METLAKPIYNAYILAAKLKENVLASESANENLIVLPTKDDEGNYAVMISYSSKHFGEDLPEIEENVEFSEDLTGRKVTVWCIDKETTNPYRLYQKMGIETPTEEEVKILREEGRLKPVCEYICSKDDKLSLKLTANAMFLITVTDEK